MSGSRRIEVEVGHGVTMSARLEGEGPSVVLLHGVPGSAAIWEPVIGQLRSEFQVIAPDLLGFGGSSRVSGDSLLVSSQASAVHALLAELGVEKPTVVGHDFGGPVALTMEAMVPGTIGRLVLSATNTFPDTYIPFPLSSILLPVVGGLARKAIFSRPSLGMMLRQGVGKKAPRLDPSPYLGDQGQSDAIASIFAHSLLNLREVYSPIEDSLRNLRIPVSVVWGNKDPFFPLAHGQRTAAAADVELIVYEGAGHFIPEERPHDFARDIAILARATPETMSMRA